MSKSNSQDPNDIDVATEASPRYDPVKVKNNMINVFCKTCRRDTAGFYKIGKLVNAWEKVTGSRYMQVDPYWKADVKAVFIGESLNANAGTVLENCSLQTIFCQGCREKLGFQCISAPNSKARYRYKQFFQLDKLIMRDTNERELNVEPIIGEDHILAKDDKVRVAPQMRDSIAASAQLSSATNNNLVLADRAAVEATNNGSMSWKEAHEQWLERTQRELSPSAFGKRILELGGGRRPRPLSDLPQPTQTTARLLDSTPAMVAPQAPTLMPMPSPQLLPPNTTEGPHKVGPSITPHAGITRSQMPAEQGIPHNSSKVGPSTSRFPAIEDSLVRQRQDIVRIDNAVSHLQTTMQSIVQQVEAIKQEVRARPAVKTSSNDDESLDLLTENLSNVMTKAAEIDSLKLQIGVMQRRMKRLEEGNMEASATTSLKTDMTPTPMQHAQLPHSQPNTQMSQAASQAVNGEKRPLPWATQPDPKRIKTGEDESMYTDVTRQSAGQPHATASPYFGGSQPLGSPDVWQSAIQPLNAYSPNPPKRGPGRPRKNPLPEQNSSSSQSIPHDWPATQLSEAMADFEYYSPDRGQIVRRGSSFAAHMTPNGRRGRSRPIRNEAGVLIRRDGKPDRRSQTSAENLRRIMSRQAERRAEEAQQTGSRSGASPSQPMMIDDDGGSPYNEYASEGQSPSESATTPTGKPEGAEQPTNTNSSATAVGSTHPEIMKRMFPNGVSEEARRLDFASQLFRINSPADAVREKEVAKMAPRSDLVDKAGMALVPERTMQDSMADGDVEMQPAGVEHANGSTATG